MQRKPVPNLGKGPSPANDNRHDNNDPTKQTSQVRSGYAPSAQNEPSQITFEDIENAISNMQDGYSANGEGSLSVRAGSAQPAFPPAAPTAVGTQSTRPPSVSSETLLGTEQDGPRHEGKLVGYGPPTLPAINSEEVFDWGDLDRQPAPNPFVDNAEVVPLKSHAVSHAQGYVQPPLPVPPQPVVTPDPKDSYSRTQTPYGGYSEYGTAYSRPASAYPSTRPVSTVNPSTRPVSTVYSSYTPDSQTHISPERPSSYAHTQSSSSQGHHSPEQGLPTHYNAQGELIVDHYGRDAEAYASALDLHSRRQARSRSVTPMGNEEYMAVDDDSMDYSTTDGHDQDPEKEGYGYEDEEFDYEKGGYGYSEFAPKVQFLDPKLTQRTPASMYPDTPVTTQHYGPAPAGRVMRRHKQKKRVQLTNGNLVIDLNVPTKLVLPLRREPEMMKTRYTAVTCDPDDFERNNFFLRQNEYGRTTEMFIVITMYNEDEVLFCRTLHGVMRNIGHLCTRKNSQTWGQDAWKKIVVCIVADGRKKIHPRILDCLTALGVYQHGDFMKNMINNKPVTGHLFEYTTSFGLDENLHFRYPDKGIVPAQILFYLKEKNQKKINSHRWFFNAFAPLLKPNVCVLIDVGTRPGRKSLYHLWKTFDLNSNVGGACGEIAAYKGRHWRALINPLVASQNFEYKISNILDKPTESLFGYISVLPGAFSAYRYIALQNNKMGVGPLASYFKGEVLHGRETDIFTSNMYLAEDRILCFELIAKENSDWVLRYVKSAVGETDVPDALPEFISQRRRWLNGSFFASVYSVAHVAQILRSGHSTGRKVMLMIETFYNVINLIFSWFSLGNFYLFFIIVTSSIENPAFGLSGISYVNTVIQYIYASLVVACFLFSMGNKPKASPWKYKLSSIFFAILNIYALVCAVVCAIQASHRGGKAYSVMLFSVVITYGVYAISSLLALDPWHMLTSFLPYMLLSPTYVNVLNIYAFSNLDDISWGTKQDKDVDTDLGAVIQNSQSQVDVEILTEPSDVNEMYDETLSNLRTRKPVATRNNASSEVEKEQQAKDYYANVRTNVLLSWVLSNGVLLVAILSVGDPSTTFSSSGQSVTRIYMTFILAFVGITNIIRFGGSTLYMLAYILMG